jgi:hypothetical protein
MKKVVSGGPRHTIDSPRADAGLLDTIPFNPGGSRGSGTVPLPGSFHEVARARPRRPDLFFGSIAFPPDG